MQMNDMTLVSVDDHICEPPDMWDGHLDAKWKSRAPKLITKEDGTNMWVFEGQQIPNVGLNAVAGRPPEEYGLEPTALSQLRPGCYDVDARIDDMNANGVLGIALLPVGARASVGELFGRKATDKELEPAMMIQRAYNDWHIDEWCASAPRPLHPPRDSDRCGIAKLLADEVRRVAKQGLSRDLLRRHAHRALGLSQPARSASGSPSGRRAPTRAPSMCMHIGSGHRHVQLNAGRRMRRSRS